MSKAHTWIGVAAAFGLACAVGCYRERTVDGLGGAPFEEPAPTSKAAPPPAKTVASPRPTAKPGPEQARAQKLADETKRYAERVGAAAPTTAQARRVAVAAEPAKSKRAAHVASDAVETGKGAPMAKGPSEEPQPPRLTTAPAPTKVETPEPIRPAVKPPPAKRAEAPPAEKPTAAVEPETPKPAPKVEVPPQPKAKTPEVVEKPEVKVSGVKPIVPKPTSKTPPPTKSVPAEVARQAPKPEPESPSPAQTVTAAPEAPTKTTSGFVVPKPPTISTKPAKSRSEQLAKAPAPPPTTPRAPARTEARASGGPSAPARSGSAIGAAVGAEGDIDATKKQKLQEVMANPNDLTKQMEYRLLCLATNDTKGALIELPGTNAQTQAVIDKLMKVNITAYKSSGRDTATAATKLLNNVEDLRKLLTRHADLEISALALCTRVDGFGVYQEMKPLQFPAGKRHRAIVYCEIKNFTSVPTEDGQYRVLLALRLTLLDSDGKTVFRTADDDIPYTSRRRLEDFFLRQLVELPTSLPVGKYILRAYVEDKLGAKAQEGQITFTVVPEASQ